MRERTNPDGIFKTRLNMSVPKNVETKRVIDLARPECFFFFYTVRNENGTPLLSTTCTRPSIEGTGLGRVCGFDICLEPFLASRG